LVVFCLTSYTIYSIITRENEKMTSEGGNRNEKRLTRTEKERR